MTLSELFTNIANAIRGKDGTTATITPTDFASRISAIETGVDTSDATATASDMAKGVTAYVNGEKVTGNVATFQLDPCHIADSISQSDPYIVMTKSNNPNQLYRAGTGISVITDKSNFGDATASDVAYGKTFTSSAGLKVTGSVNAYDSGAPFSAYALNRYKNTNDLAITTQMGSNAMIRSGGTITLLDPLTNFGDATAADVAFGKTFTSSAGLKVTGTGAIETHTLSVIRKSNFSMSYNGGQTKFEIEVPSMTANSTILDFTAYIKYDNTGNGWIMFGLLPYNDTPIGICDTNANFSIEKCSITPGTDKVTILCKYSSVYDFLEAESLTSPSSWKDGGGFVVFQ